MILAGLGSHNPRIIDLLSQSFLWKHRRYKKGWITKHIRIHLSLLQYQCDCRDVQEKRRDTDTCWLEWGTTTESNGWECSLRGFQRLSKAQKSSKINKRLFGQISAIAIMMWKEPRTMGVEFRWKWFLLSFSDKCWNELKLKGCLDK